MDSLNWKKIYVFNCSVLKASADDMNKWGMGPSKEVTFACPSVWGG